MSATLTEPSGAGEAPGRRRAGAAATWQLGRSL